MKLTNAQMFESLAVLSQLEEEGILGFAIAQNRRRIANELTEYHAKRDELLAEYGAELKPGQFTLTPEAAQKFTEALQPYSDMTADVAIRQVSVDDFCSGSLTSSQMYTLYWMVEEDEIE